MTEQLDHLIRRFEQLVRRDPANRGLIGHDGSGPGRGELLPAARLFSAPSGVVGIVTGFFIPRSGTQPAGIPLLGSPGESPSGGNIPHHATTRQTGQPHDTPERVPGEPQTDEDSPQTRADRTTSPPSPVDYSALGNAETDGPPGAAVLAAVLAELGFEPRLLTDEACQRVVEEAVVAVGLSRDIVVASPIDRTAGRHWLHSLTQSNWAARLTHLVSIERVGPSHTRESIGQNDPAAVTSGDFDRHVHESRFDRCFNMRGEEIDHLTAALHELFPERRPSGHQTTQGHPPPSSPESHPTGNHVHTIGIGDGGNEIGMGRFAWSHLRERLRGDSVGHIPCRIETDRTIVSGTSNLGAYALAASISALHDRLDAIHRHTCAAQKAVLEQLVTCAGAVDGVTRRHEPTVDGVPFLTGIQPWAAIRRELGLRE